jgi:hypothetical protein
MSDEMSDEKTVCDSACSLRVNAVVASSVSVYTETNFALFASCSKSKIACWGSPQAPYQHHIRGELRVCSKRFFIKAGMADRISEML